MTDNTNHQPEAVETPLESWKEISAYLKRAVRTVKRWEQFEGLPVHRHQHHSRSSVYAYPSELDSWLSTREPESLREDEAVAPIPRWRALTALAAVLLLTLVSVGSGPLPSRANAADGPEVVAKRVWSGADLDVLGSPSPDGCLLSFVDWSTGDLAVRDLEKNVSRRLTNKGPWSKSNEYAEFSLISPDAKQVAYAWFNDKFYELRVIGMDGAGQRVLHRNPEVFYVQPSGWAPDGKHLYATFSRKDRTNQIVRVAVADGAVQVLKSFDWRYPRLKLSPDGRFLAYDFPPKEDSRTRDIYLLATDGSREIPLVQHAANEILLGWAPDGRSIVFDSNRTGTGSVWSLPVDEKGAPGEAKLIRQNLGTISPIGFDASGSFYYGVGGGRDVFIADFDPVTLGFTGQPRNVTEQFVGSNIAPEWSPDGERLAYMSQRGTPRVKVIVLRSLRTGEEKELRPSVDLIPNPNRATPRWSPDGRYLLALAKDTKGRTGVYKFGVDSGEETLLIPLLAGNLRSPSWSADGKSIYYHFSSDEDPEKGVSLRAYDLATKRERILHTSQHIHAASLSPDGTQFAISSASPEQAREVAMANRLLLLPVTGGEPRLLRSLRPDQEFSALAWAPGGQALLFITARADQEDKPLVKHKVWRVSLSGGEPELTRLEMEPSELQRLRFHPDGKSAALTVVGLAENEIWVLQNFLPQTRAAK